MALPRSAPPAPAGSNSWPRPAVVGGNVLLEKLSKNSNGEEIQMKSSLILEKNHRRFGDVDKTCNVTNKCKGLLCLVCPSVWTRLEPYLCLKTSQFAVCLHLCHIHIIRLLESNRSLGTCYQATVHFAILLFWVTQNRNPQAEPTSIVSRY